MFSWLGARLLAVYAGIAQSTTITPSYFEDTTPGRQRSHAGSGSAPPAQETSAAGRFAPAMCEKG
jgi:hypothetical protein